MEEGEGQNVHGGVEGEGQDVHGGVEGGGRHVHEGEREEEREEDIARQPEEDDTRQQQPAGHSEYSLSPELESSPIESRVRITESFLEPARDYFRDIDQRYNATLEKRKEIDTLLKVFKEKLGLPANANFPACFKELRKRVGKYDILEISRDEPLRIILGDEVNGDGVREAVEKFNSMLQKCREFPAEMEAASAYIEEKMEAVRKEPLQTEKTVTALENSNHSLQQIQSFGQEIDKLIRDVNFARGDLESKPVTGMHALHT